MRPARIPPSGNLCGPGCRQIARLGKLHLGRGIHGPAKQGAIDEDSIGQPGEADPHRVEVTPLDGSHPARQLAVHRQYENAIGGFRFGLSVLS